MSLMSTLYTGYSGLQVSQLATDITGNNIANAENPKYTRQRVDVSARFSLPLHPGDVGTGAQADQVVRIHDEFVYGRLRNASTALEYQQTMEKNLVEISKYFPDVDEVGIQRDLIAFFDSWQKLAANPSEDSQKIVLAESAKNLGRSIQDARGKMTEIQRMSDELIVSGIDEVNRLGKRISEINKEVRKLEAHQYNHANKLRDERDHLEMQLQKLVGAEVIKKGQKTMTDVNPNIADFGEHYSILVGGFAIVDEHTFHPLKTDAAANAAGAMSAVFFEHRDLERENISTNIHNGKIGALLDLRGRTFDEKSGEPADGTIHKYISNLDIFSRGIIQSANGVYAGSATDKMISDRIGSAVGLSSREAKSTPVASLDDRQLRTDVQEGDMILAVYGRDGKRMVPDLTVSVDPGSMSLKGVADAINAQLDARDINAEAVVDGGSMVLRTGGRGNGTEAGALLVAEDFSLIRNALGITGSQRLADVDAVDIPFTITNGQFDIGVYDDNGTLQAKRTITIDKASSNPLYSTLDGIAAQINMAHVDDNRDNDMTNDVDDFITASFDANRFRIIANDQNSGTFFNIDDNETGFAGAIGLHKFMEGSGAKDINLQTDFRKDPTHIQAYDLPVVGNNNIANEMQQLQYDSVRFFNDNGTIHEDTLMGRYKYVAGMVAEDTASTQMARETAGALHDSIEQQKNSISQVNVDEELTNLLRYQAGYSANARLMTTIQQMLDTLLGLKV